MTTSIIANIRKNTLLAAFAIGVLAIVSARAHAADPEEITISAPSAKIVGRDSATSAPIEETTVKARVQYDPVTLTLNSGVAVLNDNVREAAQKACDSVASFDPDDGTCVQQAVESAKAQVDAAIARARSAANG